MKVLVQKVAEGHNLTRDEAVSAMRFIMDGQASDLQIGAFLVAMKMKGEQTDEILGFVDVMREKSLKISLEDPDAIDMCGTGGDNAGTFNISTVASFVVAGAGVTVAKHGNRSVSSSCGSADVLKALGVAIELPPDKVEACINTTGIGFLFAPLFHPAMKYAAKPRTELGMKTCFNLLGPLTNPGGVKRQLIGTYSSRAAILMAQVLSQLDTVRAFVLHSRDGLDEVSLESPTDVYDVSHRTVFKEFTLEPTQFTFPPVHRSSILGASPELNARIALDVLSRKDGPHRHIVLANAAMGLLVSGKVENLGDGLRLATESVDSGKALQTLQRLREFTTS